MTMALVRALIDEALPRSIWLPGWILTAASIAFPLTYSLVNERRTWLDIPALAVWFLFVLYCGMVIARLKRNRGYAYFFVLSMALAALFRFFSYRVLGPLYTDNEEAKGI